MDSENSNQTVGRAHASGLRRLLAISIVLATCFLSIYCLRFLIEDLHFTVFSSKRVCGLIGLIELSVFFTGGLVFYYISDFLNRNRNNVKYDDQNEELYEKISNLTDSLHERGEMLTKNEDKLFKIIDAVPHCIYVRNLEGKYLLANSATAELFNTTPTHLTFRNINEFFSAERSRFTMEQDRLVFEKNTKTLIPEEKCLSLKTLKKQVYQTIKLPIVMDDGEQAILGISANITKIKELKQLLNAEKEVNQTQKTEILNITSAIETASDAVSICNPQGAHIYQNSAFTKLFGYPLEEVREKGIRLIIKDKEIFDTLVKDVFIKHLIWSGEVICVDKKGKEIPVMLRANPIKDDNDEIISFIGIHTNITDKFLKERVEAKYNKLTQHLIAEGLITPEQLSTVENNIHN